MGMTPLPSGKGMESAAARRCTPPTGSKSGVRANARSTSCPMRPETPCTTTRWGEEYVFMVPSVVRDAIRCPDGVAMEG